MAFVHLHNHTEYSLLDGMTHVEDMVSRAAELGMPAIAITDHGVMSGAVELKTACEAIERETGRKVKPIYGCEVYFTTDDPPVREGKPKLYHLVLLAKTNAGYRNLMKLVSESHIENYRFKPQTTLPMLQRYGEGLVGMSACPAGLVPRLLDAGRFDEACDWARRLASCFAPGDFYIELQDQGIVTDGGFTQAQLNLQLARLGATCGLKTVATSDFHYLSRENAAAHEMLLCIGTGARLNDIRRPRFPNDQYYMKTEAEMREVMAAFPEACDNTIEVAEKCNVEIGGELSLPRPPIPGGKTEESWFCELCERGLVERYGAAGETSLSELSETRRDVVARYEYERDVIMSAGFARYFLVVWEYIAWARDRGICVGPGRGPVAGSIVAYSLGITEVDPIAHGLLLERFINPERPQMPDIDVDIEDGRRGEVLAHIEEVYGKERVARITTYGMLRGKNAVRDAARVLGYPYGVSERVCRMMGYEPWATVDDALSRWDGELKAAYEAEDDVREIVDAARAIEGYLRGWGVHACGVALCSDALAERVPLRCKAGQEGVVTQYDTRGLEVVGIAKFDLLGLRTLGVLAESCRNVELSHGLRMKPDDVPHDDELAFALLRGELGLDSEGLFQLGGVLYESFFRRVEPRDFSQVVAAIALNRPGPLETGMTDDYVNVASGRNPVRYYDGRLIGILGETYGMLVYQEQVMRIAEEMCGFTPAEADDLRAAMFKKDIPSLRRFQKAWIEGAVANGFDSGVAMRIWDDAEKFGRYTFQKAHATAYAVLAMRTAYMKAHCPAEYMAAVLTGNVEKEARCIRLVDSCKRSGLDVLCPDVNYSDVEFRPSGDGIRFGMMGIRALVQRRHLAEAIVAERECGGLFSSPEDFVERLGGELFCPELIEELAKAGAFDSTGFARKQAFACARNGVNAEGEVDQIAADGEWEWRELLEREKEALGVFVSGHPLDGYERSLVAASRWRLCDLENRSKGIKSGAFAGLVRGVIVRKTKRGTNMATFALEDKTGVVTCTAFGYDELADVLFEGAVVKVEGKLECGDHGNSVIVYDAHPISL